MGLFSKKKNEEQDIKAKDKIIFKEMVNDDNLARDLVLELKNGNPLVINFSKLNEMDANKMIPFFEGAALALEGKTVMISEEIYLFALKECFLDGTLKQFIENIPSN